MQPLYFNAAFRSFIWPLLGFIFLPWTTLMYLIVWSPVTGLIGFDWAWLALAVVIDLSSYAGGAYGNRDRIPGYGRAY
jgi:hypothetical protein